MINNSKNAYYLYAFFAVICRKYDDLVKMLDKWV